MSLLKQVHSRATNAASGVQEEELGLIRIDGSRGKAFVYVRAETTLALGYVCGYYSSASATAFHVTPDISDCPMELIAGVALGAVTDNHFCYVQFRGENQNTKTDGGVAAGDPLVWDADLICDTMSGGQEHRCFGWSRSADSGSVGIRIHLNVP